MITKSFVEEYVKNIPRPLISTLEHHLVNCVERGVYIYVWLPPEKVLALSGKCRVQPLVYHFVKMNQWLWVKFPKELPEDCAENYQNL